jgi:hypothetical protein
MGIVYWSADRAERKVGEAYMKKRSQALYMALDDDDINFFWDEKEVMRFDELWKNGTNILDIAEFFNRDPDEVVVLAIDRARKGFIGKRKGGIVGISSRQK